LNKSGYYSKIGIIGIFFLQWSGRTSEEVTSGYNGHSYGGNMTISEMLQQSGILTLLGMGVVFSFLIIMIACMHLLHVAVHAFNLDTDSKKESTIKSAPAGAVSAVPAQDDAAVAAIAAAVHEKR
jgi:oxaloacetate decarboxylase (Na+ extruding) subunit gamma